MSALSEKSMACLRMAALPAMSSERARLYQEASERWSEKAVVAKFDHLVQMRYMECGVSTRTGWLTEKGRAALGEAGNG